MWHFIGSRPTFQIDGGTMNIFSRNLLDAGDDGGLPELEGAQAFLAPTTPNRPPVAALRVGFAACFATPVPNQFTEHWVLFPNFRSPRIKVEGALKFPVNPLYLESAEPQNVLVGGWVDETEFLAKVSAFVSTRPLVRYIRHVRTDSLGVVP
jgi:hypothetical protein